MSYLFALLKLQVAIGSDQYFETRHGGYTQELAILKTGPATLLNRANIVAGDLSGEMSRQLLIEQNAHPPLNPHAGLKHRDPLLA